MSEAREEGAPAAAAAPSTNGAGDGTAHDMPEKKNTPAEPSAPEGSPSTVKEDEMEAPPPPPAKPGPRLCGVCNKEVAKYKCPRCTLPYCSVSCNRVHKETHPADEPLPKPAPPPPPPPQEPLDPYSILLEHRSEFDRLFKKYPRLQSHLLQISAATLDPDAPAGNSTNSNPLYQQAQQALRAATAGMGGGKKQDVWTREVGLRTGANALREARTDPGDKGDGVREFCDLVLYLLSIRDEEDGRGGVEDLGWNKGQKRKWEGGGAGRLNSAVDMARQAAIKEDREVMRRLMEEEGYEKELKNLGIR
ncbi:protein HIT1 [Podospora conica]|nr:protein HIT1 [Schizothecium conicum]